MVQGVHDEGEEEVKSAILDLIYVHFLIFKKRGSRKNFGIRFFLHRALYFYLNDIQEHRSLQQLQIWTLKMSDSTTRYI